MENECKFIAIIGLIGAGAGMMHGAGMAYGLFQMVLLGITGLMAGGVISAICAYLVAGFATGVLRLLRRFA